MALSKSKIKLYRSVHSSKGRKESGLFLIEGPESIREALSENWPLQESVLTHMLVETQAGKELLNLLELGRIPHELCSETDLERITDTRSPQGAVALGEILEKRSQEESEAQAEVIIICEQVSDPGNLGTIIRTADWFGVRQVYVGPESVDPFNPKVVRAAAGAIFRVEVKTLTDVRKFVSQERADDRKLYAAVLNGSLKARELPQSGKRGLVLGHEIRGISSEIEAECTDTVRIERLGHTESLNLSVAAGILMYAMMKN